jgi:hypothetical protein
VASVPRAMQMASIAAPAHGLVLDYVIVGSSVTDYTFKGDTTYLISDEIYAFGTTTIEGGAVIKFDSDDTDKINVIDPQLVTATEAYRPAFLTAKDDDAVGEIISGSSGNPNAYYGNGIVFLGDFYSVPTLRYLYFHHLRNALSLGFDDSQSVNVEHSQFISCETAIFLTGSVNLRNCLFYDLYSVFTSVQSETIWNGEHLTISDCVYLADAHKPEIFFKNTIVAYLQLGKEGPQVSVATWHDDPSTKTEYITGGSVFKAGGRGFRYLFDNTYRNVGLTTITPSLLEDLKRKTTFAPPTANILDNVTIANNTTWTKTVTRDDDGQPDLGYHYDPLDYCVSRATLAGTLNVQPGTAIGFFGTYGFQNGTLNIQGTPLNRSKIVHYSAVQEQSAAWGTNAESSFLLKSGSMPTTTATFTDISTAGGASFGGGLIGTLQLTHSSLYGAKAIFDNGSSGIHTYTNNIIQHSSLIYRLCGGSGYGIRLVNNLYLNSHLDVGRPCNPALASSLTLRNNFFVKSTYAYATTGSPTITHNGYYSSTVTSQGSSAKTITSLDFVSGPLGSFYYPTTGGNLSQLIDAGSSSVNSVGLEDFSTRADHVLDSGIVDIGYHYFGCGGAWITDWTFTDIGFVLGGQNGAFRSYVDPSAVTASPWSFQSPDKKSLRMSFKNDFNCTQSHGPPYNPNTQTGNATATIYVSCATKMKIAWSGVGETELSNFELMTLSIDGNQIGSAHAPGGRAGCEGGMGNVVSDPPPPQTVVLTPGFHSLSIYTTTNDKYFHFGAYYQFNLTFEPN